MEPDRLRGAITLALRAAPFVFACSAACTFDTNRALKQIYDPATPRLAPTAPAGTSRHIGDVFPGNRFLAGRINPIAANILTYFPAPNQRGIRLGDTNDHLSAAPNTLNNNRIYAGIDHTFSERHTVSARGDYIANLNSSLDVYNRAMPPVRMHF